MTRPLRLAAVLVALASLHARPAHATPPDLLAPDTETLIQMPTGFAALAVEQEAGVDIAPAARALQRVLDAVDPPPPSAAPRDVLGAVAEAVSLACPELSTDLGSGLISAALARGRCDCDVLVTAYLTVADVFGWPLSAVFMPSHAMVLWDDGRQRVFWETTVPEERPEWLVASLVAGRGAQAALHPQTRREMVGYFVQLRASHFVDQGEMARGIADYDRAAALTPTLGLTFSNRGRAHLLTGDFRAALADFDRALALDPAFSDALYGRGLAQIALGRPADALASLAAVTALEGVVADVLHAEGLAYQALGQDAVALERFDASLRAAPNVLVYEARGALHEQAGNLGAARDDYAACLRLATGPEHEALAREVRQRLARLTTEAPATRS
ncbi:tetratricopeptide repeat protein [Rubrivirga sp. IMCC45206]|uniref:tetratricopeptide repeat protein n=1 Tax=Rubrivirga sp. IMCC45206 TaxID=3391614 RepID=UPI00398FA60C